jgi:hypothetical protein
MLGNRIRLETSTSDMNYHGPEQSTLRLTVRARRMDSYAKRWSLDFYGRSGAWFRIMLTFPRWLGPWPNVKLKGQAHD